jgi:hypothetical protein
VRREGSEGGRRGKKEGREGKQKGLQEGQKSANISNKRQSEFGFSLCHFLPV